MMAPLPVLFRVNGVPAAPVNTVAPTVVGSPYVGNTVSAGVGTWTGYPAPAYTYEWFVAGITTGVTTSTYVIQAGDDTKALTVKVTATNSQGSANATSAGVTVGTFPVNTVAPTISGTASVGQTLTATTGTWAGTATITYTYQWTRAGVNIGGATSSTYVLVSGDVASAIRCVVTGTNTYGTATGVASSNAITPAIPVNTVAPAVTGTTVVGQVLSCTTGTWTSTPSLTYTYNWSGAGTNGGSTYTSVAGDVGNNITCTVTATSVNGQASQISNSVGPITSAPAYNGLFWSTANLQWGGTDLAWG